MGPTIGAVAATGWTGLGVAAVVALLAAVVVAASVGPVLRRLPEPAEPDGKPAYAALATRGFVVGVAVLSAVAVALSWSLADPPTRPLWVVLGTVGMLLAAIDARTTWLPLPLTRVAWGLLLLAGLAGGAWAAWSGDAGAQALRSAVGFGVAGVLYYAVWRVTRGGFGFGDVRFAPLVGATAAAGSWSQLWWALVLGSVVGGLVGVVRLVRRRREAFAYAPSILVGGYLALVLAAATG